MSKAFKRAAAALKELAVKKRALIKKFDWSLHARPTQRLPEGDWSIWAIIAGRGFGKTRTGAETCREWINVFQPEIKKVIRIALVARTAADARDVMVEGESGLLSIFPPWVRAEYEPSKRRITVYNDKGVKVALLTTYSGDKPDLLRGPQHHFAWVDELAAFRYSETWDNLIFGLRLGAHPQVVVTTTPRPTKLVRDVIRDPNTHLTRGSTFDNLANLPKVVLDRLKAKYDGTRLGRQELEAAILDEAEGALWKLAWLDKTRINYERSHNKDGTFKLDLVRIVVAIDPAVTAEEGSNETGIIVVGIDNQGRGYVLEDLSGVYTPLEWAEIAVAAYHKWSADRVVAEVNNGGDLVETNIRTVDANISYRAVHASKGKHTRAEPVSALYEQGKISHVGGFAELEDQMVTWEPGLDTKGSPDRIDALVWGFTELMLGGVSAPKVRQL